MKRDDFFALTLRTLMDNGVEPSKAVTIAAVLEQRIYGIPGTPPTTKTKPQRHHETTTR